MIHLGIDIGKHALVIARSHPTAPPHQWLTTTIQLKDPDWWRQLRELTPAGCIVTVEPTGTHYLTPLLTALSGKNVQIWQIPTTTTGKIRAVHISAGKSDRTDAQALELAATWIASGRTVHGAYPLDTDLDEAVSGLRALLNNHHRILKQRTRTLNQLDQLAHSLWPALAQKRDVWLKCAAAGAITPDEIRQLAAAPPDAFRHHRAHAALLALAEQLPPGLPARPTTRAAAADLVTLLDDLNAQLTDSANRITETVLQEPYATITQRWMTIPYAVPRTGIPGNLVTIATLHVATRGHVLDFSIDQFKAAVGAHPKTRQSGDRITHERVKRGYRPAMMALRMWTMNLIRPNAIDNPVKRYHQALRTPYRTQAAVGKLARILWGVARDPDGYRDG